VANGEAHSEEEAEARRRRSEFRKGAMTYILQGDVCDERLRLEWTVHTKFSSPFVMVRPLPVMWFRFCETWTDAKKEGERFSSDLESP